jgi:hypothetical protein
MLARNNQEKKVKLVEVKEALLIQKQELSHISWIPFNVLPEMYKTLEKVMLQTNGNHFGFEGMQNYRTSTVYGISSMVDFMIGI